MTQNGVVDLDSLVMKKKVRLHGEEHEVRDMDGVGYQLFDRMKEVGPEASVTTMYEIAALCLPSFTREQVLQLNAMQVGAVVELAATKIQEVEATIPKMRTARKGASSP